LVLFFKKELLALAEAPWMYVTIVIPDALAARLGNAAELPRRALEALVLEAYRAGRLSSPELGDMLGLESRYEVDGFLKEHGVYEDYTMADLQRERESLKQLGF
jgi:hypothetical protein